jgi:Sugar (and other) transporter
MHDQINHAVMALAQAVFTWRFVPETKNRTLEEIEEQWNDIHLVKR